MNKREEIARAMFDAVGQYSERGELRDCILPRDWNGNDHLHEAYYAVVDAVLDALMEPSSMMITKGHAAGVREDWLWERISDQQAFDLQQKYLPAAFREAIRAVKEGA